jgi:RNA 3'-terminal phosphate cyclase-like protein
VIEYAKGKLLKHVRDVYLYSDHFKGAESGLSPGYGLCLVAETTTGCVKSAELMAKPQQMPEKLASQCVKLLLQEASHQGCIDSSNQSFGFLYMLLCSTGTGPLSLSPGATYAYDLVGTRPCLAHGCALVCALLDVSKIRVGKLTPYSIACLQTLYQFFSRKFKLSPVEGNWLVGRFAFALSNPPWSTLCSPNVVHPLLLAGEGLVDVSCLGIGYQNLYKKVT